MWPTLSVDSILLSFELLYGSPLHVLSWEGLDFQNTACFLCQLISLVKFCIRQQSFLNPIAQVQPSVIQHLERHEIAMFKWLGATITWGGKVESLLFAYSYIYLLHNKSWWILRNSPAVFFLLIYVLQCLVKVLGGRLQFVQDAARPNWAGSHE